MHLVINVVNRFEYVAGNFAREYYRGNSGTAKFLSRVPAGNLVILPEGEAAENAHYRGNAGITTGNVSRERTYAMMLWYLFS